MQNNAVWKLLGRHKPRKCPACGHTENLKYIGFARNYEPGINAQMYQCEACNAWVDCLWPTSMDELLLSKNIKTLTQKSQDFGKAATR